jgi:antitoxin component YwqK of YwqJK toxin-antitoxin module
MRTMIDLNEELKHEFPCETQYGPFLKAFKSGDFELCENIARGNSEWLRDRCINYAMTDGEGLIFSADGSVIARQNYKNGKLNGLFKRFRRDGSLDYSCNYENGELNGLFESFRKDGSVIQRKNYENGKLNGLREVLDENGSVIQRFNYQNGIAVKIYAIYGN